MPECTWFRLVKTGLKEWPESTAAIPRLLPEPANRESAQIMPISCAQPPPSVLYLFLPFPPFCAKESGRPTRPPTCSGTKNARPVHRLSPARHPRQRAALWRADPVGGAVPVAGGRRAAPVPDAWRRAGERGAARQSPCLETWSALGGVSRYGPLYPGEQPLPGRRPARSARLGAGA